VCVDCEKKNCDDLMMIEKKGEKVTLSLSRFLFLSLSSFIYITLFSRTNNKQQKKKKKKKQRGKTKKKRMATLAYPDKCVRSFVLCFISRVLKVFSLLFLSISLLLFFFSKNKIYNGISLYILSLFL